MLWAQPLGNGRKEVFSFMSSWNPNRGVLKLGSKEMRRILFAINMVITLWGWMIRSCSRHTSSCCVFDMSMRRFSSQIIPHASVHSVVFQVN